MPDPIAPARCPVSHGSSCREAPACSDALPPSGAERAAILVLRFIAAARDTGDACCWDAALDEAEAAFGERAGPLVVGTAAALIRRLHRKGGNIAFLPSPCRRLSPGEALMLRTLRARAHGPLGLEFSPVGDDVAALAVSIADAASPPTRRSA